tara:strand:+ start:364 stop:732 length:369 start_codon:yes stop_codon:yes gene_type:complete
MFKSKYTILIIIIFILISILNIFSIVYVEYSTVSLVKFKEHRIECGHLIDILTNKIDYTENSLLSMNRNTCKNVAAVTLLSSLTSILFLSLCLYITIRFIKNRKDIEDLSDLILILKNRNKL